MMMTGVKERRATRPTVRLLAIGLGLCILASSCGGRSGQNLSQPLISAFNALYQRQSPVTAIRLAPSSTRTRVSKEMAISMASRSYNLGSDPKVIAVGLVRATWTTNPLWAVFLNPTGNHHVPNGAGSVNTENWFVALIDAEVTGRPAFCSTGSYRGLPTLSMHN